MKIGWTEVIIILILLFFTPNIFRLILRKTYREFMKPDEGKDKTSNNARQSSTANSSNNDQNIHNEDEQVSPYHKREEQDPYKILNIHDAATQNEIASAYRKLAQMYHPDKVAGLAPEYKEIAERKMKIINAAYQTLKQ